MHGMIKRIARGVESILGEIGAGDVDTQKRRAGNPRQIAVTRTDIEPALRLMLYKTVMGEFEASAQMIGVRAGFEAVIPAFGVQRLKVRHVFFFGRVALV